jgi:hypothetical protein
VISLLAFGPYWTGCLVALLLIANAWLSSQPAKVSLSSLVLALSGAGFAFWILLIKLPNEWVASWSAVMGLILVAGYRLHKCRELTFSGLLAAAGSAAGLVVMKTDPTRFWPSLVALALISATAFSGRQVGRDSKIIRIPSGVLAIVATLLFWNWVAGYVAEDHKFWVVALASTIALVLSRNNPLRQAISVILVSAAALVFLNHATGVPVRFAPLDFFGCLLLLAQERIARTVKAPTGMAVFAGVAGLVTILFWTTSGVRYYHDQVPLTAAWALLALLVLSGGFLLRARVFRIGGLGILSLALSRIVFLDVWRLDLPLRIVSFLVLGCVLLVLGYLYNRYADRIRQWL